MQANYEQADRFDQEMEELRRVALRVFHARKALRMSQRQLGIASHTSQTLVNKVEKHGNATTLTLIRLAQGMGLRLSIEFLTEEQWYARWYPQGRSEEDYNAET